MAHVYAGEQAQHDDPPVQRRERAFLQERQGHGDRRDPADTFTSFIKKRFDATDRGVSDAAIAGLLEITHGHPYATQELAASLWDEVPLGFTASVADLQSALDAVLRSENARFTLLWENLSRSQRQLVQALAAAPGRVQSAGYIGQHGLPSASTMQKAAEVLVRQELIGKRPDGAYEIVEPFLTEWIRRYAT